MIETLYRGLLSAVFPSPCERCGKIHAAGQEGICDRCLESTFVFTATGPDDEAPEPLDGIWAVSPYEGTAKTLLCRLKFDRRKDMLGPALRLAERSLGGFDARKHWDLVTAVPMPADIKRDRGFDQSDLLARRLAKHLGLPYAAGGLGLKRKLRTQSTLSRTEREANVLGAFKARPDAFRGRRVLLVDDILTTGFTAAACARALKDEGAASVHAFVFSRGFLG